MPAAIDLSNKTFGRLRVLRKLPERNEHGKILWECLCDPELGGCGNTIKPQTSHLNAGYTNSCGCLAIEVTKDTNTKHGYCAYPEYKVWNTIKLRCYDPKSPSYKDYGARGITMSDEWKESFETFLHDMGPRPSSEYSIEREDNNGPYRKSNCKWATRTEQANNRRSSIYYEFHGWKMTLPDWCRALGLSHSTIWQRIHKLGWSFEKVVSKAMAEREITFSTSGLKEDEQTHPLEWWCGLLGLDKGRTYLRVFRGESFKDIAAK
ncbi:hypothetical protein [Ralstonia phage RP31]|uniref:Uncharacterized protein n=2 Tax=Ripduovirus RP12 TaxID=2560700 RepID=A0A1L7N0S3_9CAUD|nr:HNH endonuclease [Ralstonia phage RP12]BAW19071.1 hypothetical protein [Ralstonia phage RP12]BAW19356.1 hypothetical protein [Ralstonia phage RP31]